MRMIFFSDISRKLRLALIKTIFVLLSIYPSYAKATQFFWDTTNISVAITNANYPTIHAGDTIYVDQCSVQAGYRTVVIELSPAVKWVYSTQDSNNVKVIFRNGPNPSIKTNSGGNIFGDALSACDNVTIIGLKMMDHTDPLFFNLMQTGYLHHVWFKNDTLQNQPGLWGSGPNSTSNANYTGGHDTVNCMYDIWFHKCIFDSIGTPSSGGLTVMWMGGLLANQVCVKLTVDSCSFNYIPSVVNGATAIHCQQVYYQKIFGNTFTNLGVVAVPVGHAATIDEQASTWDIFNNFFQQDFSNCVRSISQVSTPGLTSIETTWDPTFDGICRFHNNILDHGRKYPMIEDQKDTIAISGVSWAVVRRSARIWNNTMNRGGVGIGDGPYNVSVYDWYEVTYTTPDTVEMHNNFEVGPPTDTTSGVFCYSTYCYALFTHPNGTTAFYDSTGGNFFFQSMVFATSGLADTNTAPIGFYPLSSGPLYSHGVSTPSWLTTDFHGNAVPSTGSRYDIGAAQYQSSVPSNPISIPRGVKVIIMN